MTVSLGSSSGVWSSLSGNADDSTIPPRGQPTCKGSATHVTQLFICLVCHLFLPLIFEWCVYAGETDLVTH